MRSRRDFLRGFAYSTALPLFFSHLSCGSPARRTLSYREAITTILTRLRDREASSVRDAADVIADTLIARGRCFIRTGNPVTETLSCEPKPVLGRQFVPLRSMDVARTVRSGDALLTALRDDIVEQAGSRGAHIIGIESPARETALFPPEKTSSPTVIRSHIPSTGGIVRRPGYASGILPGSGPVLAALVTALAGEIYYRSGGIGRTGDSPPSVFTSYLDALIGRTGRLAGQQQAIEAAGALSAEAVMAGGRLFVHDARGILAQELLQGGGVPSFVSALPESFPRDGGINRGDAVVFASLTSNARSDMMLLRSIRESTDTVVTLCPRDGEGGYRLFNDAAVPLDNLSPEKGGVHAFDNGARRLMHTGGVLNAVLMWSVVEKTVDALVRAGQAPRMLSG